MIRRNAHTSTSKYVGIGKKENAKEEKLADSHIGTQKEMATATAKDQVQDQNSTNQNSKEATQREQPAPGIHPEANPQIEQIEGPKRMKIKDKENTKIIKLRKRKKD